MRHPPLSGTAPHSESSDVTIYQADAREAWRWLPEHSADAIVTSPPYFSLRDYGVEGQIGLEDDPQEYIATLADLLTGYARVLKPGGSLWLNLGDTYSVRADASAAATFRHDKAPPDPRHRPRRRHRPRSVLRFGHHRRHGPQPRSQGGRHRVEPGLLRSGCRAVPAGRPRLLGWCRMSPVERKNEGAS